MADRPKLGAVMYLCERRLMYDYGRPLLCTVNNFIQRIGLVNNDSRHHVSHTKNVNPEELQVLAKKVNVDLSHCHIPTNLFQKALLTAGSAYISLFHSTTRPDMMAVFGETTEFGAIKYMHKKMLNDEEGMKILRDRPRINTKTVDLVALQILPKGTLGRAYADFLQVYKITPDSRGVVQYVDDIELAYVLQRFREIHDLIHVLLRLPTNVSGEVAVKWVEGIQTRLPVCIMAAIFGPMVLNSRHRKIYMSHYLPWAIKTGFEAHFLLNVYFEKRWEQSVSGLFNELNIRHMETSE